MRSPLAALFVAIFLIFPSGAFEADHPVVTGNFQLEFDRGYGQSIYTIFYTYPTSLPAGSNFTVQTYMYVTKLGGLKLYVENYVLSVSLNFPSGLILEQSVSGPPGQFLYEGARWGPLNTTIPLNSTISSEFRGSQSLKIDVRMGLATFELYEGYMFPTAEGGQREVGSVSVLNSSPTPRDTISNLAPYLVVVLVAVTVGSLVALRKLRKW